MSQDLRKKNSQQMLAGIIFLLAGIALYLSWDSAPLGDEKKLDGNQNGVQNSKEYLEKTRSHLMMTADEIRFREIKNQHEILHSAPSLNSTSEQKNIGENEGLDLSYESTAKDLAEELRRNNDQTISATETPGQLIQQQIFEQNQLEEYSLAYKEEYARKFLENARNGGWDVELTDDFRIKSIKKIRNPAGQNIFNYNSVKPSNRPPAR